MLHWTGNDPFVEEIARRARSVLARQPGVCPGKLAADLELSEEKLQCFLSGRERLIDTTFLIDLVAALVRECGVDPKWVLTGQYDGALHRQALLLGEDRTPKGAHAVRELVQAEYRQVRRPGFLTSMPARVSAFFR